LEWSRTLPYSLALDLRPTLHHVMQTGRPPGGRFGGACFACPTTTKEKMRYALPWSSAKEAGIQGFA